MAGKLLTYHTRFAGPLKSHIPFTDSAILSVVSQRRPWVAAAGFVLGHRRQAWERVSGASPREGLFWNLCFSSSRWLPDFHNANINKFMLPSQDSPEQKEVEN